MIYKFTHKCLTCDLPMSLISRTPATSEYDVHVYRCYQCTQIIKVVATVATLH